MADSQSNALIASAQRANRILLKAHDDHAWRAESFAATVNALASGGEEISPTALQAVAHELGRCVNALTEAIHQAHEILNGRGDEADSQFNALIGSAQRAKRILLLSREYTRRAESFAATVNALASGGEEISPTALQAVAHELGRCVNGLTEAIHQAHEILNGRGGEA